MGLREEDNINIRDTILFLQIGRIFEDKSPKKQDENFLKTYRLNKGMAAILRHWHTIREIDKNYADIHVWGIQHTAYRLGQVIFLPRDIDRKIILPDYLKSLIEKNPILSENIDVKDGGTTETDDVSNPFHYHFKKSDINGILPYYFSKLAVNELNLANHLANFYGSLETKYLFILSTIPTANECLNAMEAEINIWFGDIDELFRNCKECDKSSGLEYRLGKTIKKAFRAAQEIIKKKELYDSVDSELAELISTHYNAPQIILEPLHMLRDRHSELNDERKSVLLEAANIMTGYLGLCKDIIAGFQYLDISEYIDSSMDYTLHKKSEALLQFYPELVPEIEAHEANESFKGRRLYELVNALDTCFKPWRKRIEEHFEKKQLPTKYDVNKLFGIRNQRFY